MLYQELTGFSWLLLPSRGWGFILFTDLASWPMKLVGAYTLSPFLQWGSYPAGYERTGTASDAVLPEVIADHWSLPVIVLSPSPAPPQLLMVSPLHVFVSSEMDLKQTPLLRDTWAQGCSLMGFLHSQSMLLFQNLLSKQMHVAYAFLEGHSAKQDRTHNTLGCWSFHISICLDCPHVFFFCLLSTTEEPPSHSFYLSIPASLPCLFPYTFHPVFPCCLSVPWLCLAMGVQVPAQ